MSRDVFYSSDPTDRQGALPGAGGETQSPGSASAPGTMRRRRSGMAYIRDGASRRGMYASPSMYESKEAHADTHLWGGMPDPMDYNHDLYRSWRSPRMPGLASAEAASRTLPPWRMVGSHAKYPLSAHDASFMRFEPSAYPSYAASSVPTLGSSSQSSSSPLFSESATTASRSIDTPLQSGFPEPSFSGGSPSMATHSSPRLSRTQPRRPPMPSPDSHLHGLGVSFQTKDPSVLTRRVVTEPPRLARSPSHSGVVSTPTAPPPRAHTRRQTISDASSHLHKQAWHRDDASPASHSGLERWFPGLMYAFEPSYGSPHTPAQLVPTTPPAAMPEGELTEWAALALSTHPASPPLRSLQLVSKYFGDESLQDTPTGPPARSSRRGSAGDLHGLYIHMSPSLSVPDDDDLYDHSSSSPSTPVPASRTRLRPLHLAEMHGLEQPGMSRRSPPRFKYEDERGTRSPWMSDRTHSSRSRVPYHVLHPRPEKPIADPDAVRLFWFGFLGMPWLWIFGGWCAGDHAMLLSPWSPPSFASYRVGLHPYGPPFAMSMCMKNRLLQHMSPISPQAAPNDPVVFGPSHRGVQFLSQHAPDSIPLYQLHQWQHVERVVLVHRVAAALSSFAFFACWGTGVWPVVSHF
ncbi:hypothetical protein ACI68E_001107 [Malassezia pachydermatis]|uniref:Uncharacterized protein n=1 Tax=Malassezia pachydermatis TaxID=77020 RepID=A0A0N0RS00_9BASI|nr:hypothetical protein Malapachy_1553 [Malassezia pachydermatis]KOS13172.1 hypothetical protein Malapachy_1553 [Malassezia pachydermatis]